MPDDDWTRVIFSYDCDVCDGCGEPVCPVCHDHYFDCECPGPQQEGYLYEEREQGWYAKRILH